jgi:hypothetical protein
MDQKEEPFRQMLQPAKSDNWGGAIAILMVMTYTII